jgi:hypothetical protein
MEPLLPLLKPADWDLAPKSKCRRLIKASEADSLVFPWVAFGHDEPSSFEFLPSDSPLDMESVEHEALLHLQDRPAKWTLAEGQVPDLGALRFLHFSDDFFAAERILDPMFLNEAQEQLDAQQLAVACPRRGLLFAMAIPTTQGLLNAYWRLASIQYHRAPTPAQLSGI